MSTASSSQVLSTPSWSCGRPKGLVKTKNSLGEVCDSVSNTHVCVHAGRYCSLLLSAHNHVMQALAVLTDLVSSVAGENSKSKTVLFTSVKSSVELAANLLSVYFTYPGQSRW